MRKNAFELSECKVCGEEFQKPLHASVTSDSKVSEYYACPRCLSQVDFEEKTNINLEARNEVLLSEERVQELSLNAEELTREGRFEIKAECQHELGYLKKRPRNTEVPDQCLICAKMIECMTA